MEGILGAISTHETGGGHNRGIDFRGELWQNRTNYVAVESRLVEATHPRQPDIHHAADRGVARR